MSAPAAAPSAAPAAASARLRWQCRRGTLELDLLLSDFMRRHGDALPAAEAQLLAQWLAQDDDDLLRTLANPPAAPAAAALAGKILPRAAAAKH